MIKFYIEKMAKKDYEYYAVCCEKNGKRKILSFDLLTCLWCLGCSLDDLERLAVGEKIYIGGNNN